MPYVMASVTLQRQVGLTEKANCLESVSSLYTENPYRGCTANLSTQIDLSKSDNTPEILH